MKWNWGSSIFLMYGLFVAGILLMVTMAFRQRVDLENRDYYARELVFQHQIDKMHRSRALNNPLKVMLENRFIVIRFPFTGSALSGKVELFRPSNAENDHLFYVNADVDGNMKIPAAAMAPGAYRVKVDWEFQGITYYDEQVLLIQ